MKKRISVVAFASLFVAGSAFASGYRIPEQSIDSTAKAGANVASADKADASYFNPANMTATADAWQVEADLTYIHLTAVDYKDNRTSSYDATSEKENFYLPTLYMISPDYNDFRFGFSVTTPYGLAKRWQDPFAAQFSEKFSLLTVELNPTVAYEISDMFSVAGGVRMLYSEAHAIQNAAPKGYQDLSADSIDWGYNLALAVTPTEESNISVTYRSAIEMTLEGDVSVMAGSTSMSMGAESSSFPAPAVLAISGAYTFDLLTVELTWDRTFWSEYDSMNITYEYSDAAWSQAFGLPAEKNWVDTNAYRIGLEYAFSDFFTLMGGFAYDENPVPDETLDFSLPDSDALLFSVGARFQVTEQMELGFGALYDYKESREVSNGAIDGEFTNSSAFLFTAGLGYKF